MNLGYIYYCPRCGNIIDEYEYESGQTKCKCKPIRQISFIRSDKKEREFKRGNVPKAKGASGHLFTKEMWYYIWDKYVDIPTNKQLDRTKFNTVKYTALYQFQHGTPQQTQQRYQPANETVASCPKCHSKSIVTMKKGFNIANAAVGAIAAGPYGALAGGIGANDVINVCQNCGHKWEPGK